MTHLTLPRFWKHYARLLAEVQRLADKNFSLLKANPDHPSLDFKKVARRGNCGQYVWAITTVR